MTAHCKIGVMSDTHGLLRPDALSFLHAVDRIVHAGDIGHAGVLETLTAIAPVTVVRGNNDQDAWADHILETEVFTVGGLRVLAIHDLSRLNLDLVTAGINVVISGHSHKPNIERRNGVLFINPGSCGPRRFKLPISIGQLTVGPGVLDARIVELPGALVLSQL